MPILRNGHKTIGQKFTLVVGKYSKEKSRSATATHHDSLLGDELSEAIVDAVILLGGCRLVSEDANLVEEQFDQPDHEHRHLSLVLEDEDEHGWLRVRM